MVSYPLPICQHFHDIIYPDLFLLCVFAALKTIITLTVDVFAFPHMAVVQRLQRTRMWMKRVCSNTPPLWPTSSVGTRLQCDRLHWTVSMMAESWQNWCANHFQHLEHHEVIKTLSPSALSIHQLAAQGEVSQVAAHLSKGEGSGHKADQYFLSFFVNWNVRKFLHPLMFCRQLTAQQTGWTGLHSSHVGGSVRREGSGGFSPGEG